MSNVIKTNYYDQFSCIADKCSFTCCQEWAISVDEKTVNKWRGLKLDESQLGEQIQSKLILCDCLSKEDSGHIIELDKDKLCPFLNRKKLCRLVTELSEELLSETCMTYPRLINKFEDRTEYALDFGCPAVIDLVNEQVGAIQFLKEGNDKQIRSVLYWIREMMFTLIQDKDYSLTERVMMIFCSLLELLEEEEIDEVTIKAYNNKEYLDGMVNEIRKMNFNPIDSLWEKNELFLDMIQVYREQELYTKQLEEIIGLAERLAEYYSDEILLKKSEKFEKEYEEYQELLEKYLVAEIFGSSLSEDMNLEDMVLVFQWITLEYSVMKQVVFLKWLSQDEKQLEYEVVREHMMIVARMAGYDKSDIKEFLENSFESIQWDWGYLALVIGNSKI